MDFNSGQKYKGFPNGPDGRLDTKIDQIDLCHIFMSYASYGAYDAYDAYVAYDVEIWHKSILSILVSKRPSEHQQSRQSIQLWQK